MLGASLSSGKRWVVVQNLQEPARSRVWEELASRKGKERAGGMLPAFQLSWFGWGRFPQFYWIIVVHIMEKVTARLDRARGNGKH